MSQSLKKLWKQSSSLIILGKNAEATKSNRFNYKVRETFQFEHRKIIEKFISLLLMKI